MQPEPSVRTAWAGLQAKTEFGGRTISHSGIFWTYKSEETVYLDEQMGIAVMFNSGLNDFVNYSAFIDGIADIMRGEKPEASFLNGRNMETIMIALILATLVWGVVAYFRIRRRNKRLTISKLILITVGRLIPILILFSLSLHWYGRLSISCIWLATITSMFGIQISE